jgi:hypothetical protein
MTKQQRKPRQPVALPPTPSAEAVRLGALQALLALVTGERDTTREPFALLTPGTFADECLESPAAVFARLIARGEHPAACAAVLGIDYGVIALALVDLARAARVDWAEPAPGQAVA